MRDHEPDALAEGGDVAACVICHRVQRLDAPVSLQKQQHALLASELVPTRSLKHVGRIERLDHLGQPLEPVAKLVQDLG